MNAQTAREFVEYHNEFLEFEEEILKRVTDSSLNGRNRTRVEIPSDKKLAVMMVLNHRGFETRILKEESQSTILELDWR